MTESILSRLLVVAVSDQERRVRTSILEALLETGDLEEQMAQADCLRCLFLALNDESFAVRDGRAAFCQLRRTDLGQLHQLLALIVWSLYLPATALRVSSLPARTPVCLCPTLVRQELRHEKRFSHCRSE